MRGKGIFDNHFILRGIIDHAMYLRKQLWITFYDTEKCFGSLSGGELRTRALFENMSAPSFHFSLNLVGSGL